MSDEKITNDDGKITNDDGKITNDDGKIGYDAAVAEIETILQKIESGDLDVDELAEKVDRATRLLRICQERLRKTETQIDRILRDDEEET